MMILEEVRAENLAAAQVRMVSYVPWWAPAYPSPSLPLFSRKDSLDTHTAAGTSLAAAPPSSPPPPTVGTPMRPASPSSAASGLRRYTCAREKHQHGVDNQIYQIQQRGVDCVLHNKILPYRVVLLQLYPAKAASAIRLSAPTIATGRDARQRVCVSRVPHNIYIQTLTFVSAL